MSSLLLPVGVFVCKDFLPNPPPPPYHHYNSNLAASPTSRCPCCHPTVDYVCGEMDPVLLFAEEKVTVLIQAKAKTGSALAV